MRRPTTADLEPFRRSVVRIQSRQNVTVGLGWRFGPYLAATCAHVVTGILGGDYFASDPPLGSLRLQSAIDAIDLGEASLCPGGWFPKRKSREADEPADIALLSLPHAPRSNSKSAELSSLLTPSGIRCKLLGTQSVAEEPLVPIDAVVGDVSNGRFLLHQVSSVYGIGPGCSGAPVVDEATGNVVGIVVEQELAPGGIAYMIPAAQIRECLHRTGLLVRPSSRWPLESIRSWMHREIAHHDPTLARQLTDFITVQAVGCRDVSISERECEMLRLQSLLQDGRLVFLTRRTGRGNSAPLLYFASHLLEQLPEITLLYIPISARLGTAREECGLRLLCLQMGSLFGELRLDGGEIPSIKDYRDRILRGWEFIRNREHRRFALIVDGVDEAVEHWWDDKVLPVGLPKNLSVLVSAGGAMGPLAATLL